MTRVRFAPSPTGYLHVGNARTALFNYLFARKTGGQFILRIEDTDKERSKPEYETALIEDLKWLGTEWDEGPDIGGACGPYRQTERMDTYREYAEKLLLEGKVYRCYCTREELEERNASAKAQGRSLGYDGRCRKLSAADVSRCESEGRPSVLRFAMPDHTIKVNDLIRGEVVFEGDTISDFVIIKSDGMPTFHFAVVMDDYLMRVTHVIRGDDHLSNTPKHIALCEALGAEIPQYAHMAMTLGPDRARLSKRHGATSVRAFQENGYLAEAFFNYMALLGWGSSDDQEIFSKAELIREFSLERCNKSSAVFDHNKLLWMNGLYIRKTPPSILTGLALPFLKQHGLISDSPSPETLALCEKTITLEQEKIKTLLDVPERIGFFIREPVYDPKAVEKHLNEKGKTTLKLMLTVLEGLPTFSTYAVEMAVREFCEKNACKTGDVFHPLRVAVSGTTKGPGLFEMLEVLGKDTVVKRIKTAISYQPSV